METGTVKHLYTLLADLLVYPKEDIRPKAAECLKALEAETRYPPEVLEEFKRFNNDLGRVSLDDLQQVYSYTFELTSDYTLDMGFHIFDGFKRSNSLASIKVCTRIRTFLMKRSLKESCPIISRWCFTFWDSWMMRN